MLAQDVLTEKALGRAGIQTLCSSSVALTLPSLGLAVCFHVCYCGHSGMFRHHTGPRERRQPLIQACRFGRTGRFCGGDVFQGSREVHRTTLILRHLHFSVVPSLPAPCMSMQCPPHEHCCLLSLPASPVLCKHCVLTTSFCSICHDSASI